MGLEPVRALWVGQKAMKSPAGTSQLSLISTSTFEALEKELDFDSKK